jgi:hypothetical protein
MSIAYTNNTYRRPEVLICEPYISSEAQARQAFIGVHLKDITLILRGRMPNDIVLNQDQNSRTYGAGFQF